MSYRSGDIVRTIVNGKYRIGTICGNIISSEPRNGVFPIIKWLIMLKEGRIAVNVEDIEILTLDELMGWSEQFLNQELELATAAYADIGRSIEGIRTKSQRIDRELESASKAIKQLPQWMQDIEARRQAAYKAEQQRLEEEDKKSSPKIKS